MSLLLVLSVMFGCVSMTSPPDVCRNDSSHSMDVHRYYHTKEELDLITHTPVIDPKHCSRPVFIFTPSAAVASGKYYQRRQSVRKTWAKEAKEEYNMTVVFVLGLNKNQSINDLIRKESEKHQDIIQFDFIDAYFNFTLKVLAMFEWIHNNCPNTEYILKADDDVVVNIRKLLATVKTVEQGISGRLGKNAWDLDKCEVEYMPDKYVRKKQLPDLVWGGAYIYTKSAVQKLVAGRRNYTDHFLDREDIFINGLLAEALGIPRHNLKEISFMAFHSGCVDQYLSEMDSLIALIECKSSDELVKFYSDWKRPSVPIPGHLLSA